MTSIRNELELAGERPADTANRAEKKNYAERLSRAIAKKFADSLRGDFPGMTPDPDGRRQEARARTAKGFKRLDVNYSTPELGLGLGISIKTINFRDRSTATERIGRYTKNYSRTDNELRAEATDYHQRQPYSVLIAVIFLPIDSCDDSSGNYPSSFGAAIKHFRHLADRVEPTDDVERFERVFMGLYEANGPDWGEVSFFDVMASPPKAGRPTPDQTLDWKDLVSQIIETYDVRNNPPFEWS